MPNKEIAKIQAETRKKLIKAALRVSSKETQLSFEDEVNIVCEVYGVKREQLLRELRLQEDAELRRKKRFWWIVKITVFILASIINLVLPPGWGIPFGVASFIWLWWPLINWRMV